jgi:CheY-like chemotaxis protein
MTYPSPIPGGRPVLAIVSDLLFRSKIDEVARRLGLEMRVARSLEQLDRHLARGEPAVTLVDLEAETLDTSAAIRRIRAAPWGAGARIVGFAGHTNVGAIQAGRAAGAGVVLARSAFTAQLPELLARVAEEERGRTAGE